ncbi:rod shape-determining protein MreD [Actinobacillus delphinicola]|uniref:rod shape-determining protein MreD n=1 Tax=Actinobacillus delphinicola TaxID=51161 RepID=UPI0024434751|nr:rod shape-determining protein MreD [Actinobacillus delphinicola]MDG6897259.1 rod shape-determining protein MreD [Actinobacillus delphinicola]
MKNLHWGHYLCILIVFFLAVVLQVLPWPQGWQGARPAWLVLAVMYWILVLPDKINIGTAFVIGIVWDLVTGSVLGVHAMVLVIFAYFIRIKYMMLRNLSLWFQSILVIFFVMFIRLGLFVIEYILYHNVTFDPHCLYGALLSGILWPWLVLLLRSIRYRIRLY